MSYRIRNTKLSRLGDIATMLSNGTVVYSPGVPTFPSQIAKSGVNPGAIQQVTPSAVIPWPANNWQAGFQAAQQAAAASQGSSTSTATSTTAASSVSSVSFISTDPTNGQPMILGLDWYWWAAIGLGAWLLFFRK